ncbi:alpha/beta fold hydrolase [Rhodococcus sp. NPDC127530]|uniref:alpha/beta fold hydrolase n=1 Tax=unclassified Rhodococcus (in: high G+C Gram-positive bacteria) TaxID=192944 RepID=UPI0036322200
MHVHSPSGISGSLAFFDSGDRHRANATTTVYLGGLGSASSVAFTSVVAHPATQGRSITVDLFGSGWSDHPDDFTYSVEDHAASVASVLDSIGLELVSLVGHSLGGSIAIALST